MTAWLRKGVHVILVLPLAFALTALMGITPILKSVIADVLPTATVIVMPGTRQMSPFSPDPSPQFTPALMQDALNGWLFDLVGNDPSNWKMSTQYRGEAGVLTSLHDDSMGESIEKGTFETIELVNATTGEKYLFGYSQGAVIVKRAVKVIAASSDAPPANELVIVTMGDPSRPNGGVMHRLRGLYVPVLDLHLDGAMPDTQYQTIIVTREGDIYADLPSDPLNPLPWLGILTNLGIHGDYKDVDIYDANNIVTHHGNITDIFVPAERLLALKPLYDLAAALGRTNTPILDAIEPVLRIINDAAYDRTTAEPMSFQPGSTIPRLIKKAPELVDAIAQGVSSLASKQGWPSAPEAPTSQQQDDDTEQVVNRQQNDDTTKSRIESQSEIEKTAAIETDEGVTSKKPKLPWRARVGRESADDRKVSLGGEKSTEQTAKPRWRPGDGLKSAMKRAHRLGYGSDRQTDKPQKTDSSSPSKNESDGGGQNSSSKSENASS